MKRIIVLICGIATSIVMAQELDNSLPPNPEPGKCYAKCVVANEYEYVNEKVLVRPEYKTMRVKPATFKYETERVEVKAASKRMVVIPAQYKTETVGYDLEPDYTVLTPYPAKLGVSSISYEVSP